MVHWPACVSWNIWVCELAEEYKENLLEHVSHLPPEDKPMEAYSKLSPAQFLIGWNIANY